MTTPDPTALPAPDPLRSAGALLWWVWGAVLAIATMLLLGGLLVVHAVHETEQARAEAEAKLAVDAFAEYANDVLDHAAALLYAVRWVYLRTGSLSTTEAFISGFNFDDCAIGNLYVIGADGNILTAHGADGGEINVADRDYFVFHRTHPEDRLYISPVDVGRVTGAWNFRVTRRITGPDGGFGGVVLATVEPDAFARRFVLLGIGRQNVASLIGIEDHLLRARWPAPASEKWAVPVPGTLWDHLVLSGDLGGTYRGVSPVDGITRNFSYRRVGVHPLVMRVGFSEQDVRDRVWARLGWGLPLVPAAMLLLFGLALLATSLVRSRTALTQANAALASMALRDALTGLPSRILFSDRLENCLRLGRRSGKRCALLYLDLDAFKAINDQDGHDVGDAVLRAVAGRMVGQLRTGDTVCRWGGDEFLILIPDSESRDALLALAGRLLKALAAPLPVADGSRRVTASIGIACFPENGDTALALRAAADAALLTAKRAGKFQAVLAPLPDAPDAPPDPDEPPPPPA